MSIFSNFWGKVFNNTWWGSVCENNISFGIVYQQYAQCESDNLILENGDNMIAESGDNLISG